MSALDDPSPDLALQPNSAPTRPMSVTRPFYWSVRREIWENRSIYMAPLIAAGLVFAGFLISSLHIRGQVHKLVNADAAQVWMVLSASFAIGAAVVVVTATIVGFFYCLSALHSERSDRSILFWKSMPVSNLTTVGSKAFVPMVVLPVVVLCVVVALQLLMLLVTLPILALGGISLSGLFTDFPLFRLWAILLYGVVALALWYAPIYGWALLVSGWARRTTFLWAVLPPLALALFEKLAFGSDYIGTTLHHRVGGAFQAAFSYHGGGSALPDIDAVTFLSTPGLWLGLAVAAAFFAAAVWQRRFRTAL